MEHRVLLRKLAQAWKAQREGQGLKPGTQKHAEAQLEFWMGAYAALQIVDPESQFNPMVLMLLSVGRDCVEEFDKESSDAAA